MFYIKLEENLMCGIFAFYGRPKYIKKALKEGLRRLIYRGYDSIGVSYFVGEEIFTLKESSVNDIAPNLLFKLISFFSGTKSLSVAIKTSLLDSFLNKLKNAPEPTKNVALGHNRWATHGKPTEVNAHPHTSTSANIAVVHNGIIENYLELKTFLQNNGSVFVSQTDTEVIPQLIEHLMNSADITLKEAIVAASKQLRGAFAFSVISTLAPDTLFAVRRDSPLHLGICENGEFVLASSQLALVQHTRNTIAIGDNEVVEINSDGYKIYDLDFVYKDKVVSKIPVEITAETANKGKFEHFMQKEIHEQPVAVNAAMGNGSRINFAEGTPILGGLFNITPRLHEFDEIILTGMGTSFHAAQYGAMLIEELSGVKTKAILSTILTSTNTIFTAKTLVIAFSQSGESSDTYNALKMIRDSFKNQESQPALMAIVNDTGSKIGRFVGQGFGIYLHAGPEIAVASTKAFLAQSTAIYLFAVFLGRIKKNLSLLKGQTLLQELIEIPSKIESVLKANNEIKSLAKKLLKYDDIFIIGKGYNLPICAESALKIAEVSYKHAEGREAGEFKHGYIAMLQPNRAVIAFTPNDRFFDKMSSNIQEISARSEEVYGITTLFHPQLSLSAENLILTPETTERLYPMVLVTVTQLLAYHLAVLKGCDVDQPRNLAKSVTVE
jgi:glutamine---fructose-6-phosphate transaminase (isomerizing)